jgi:hypothetical protein
MCGECAAVPINPARRLSPQRDRRLDDLDRSAGGARWFHPQREKTMSVSLIVLILLILLLVGALPTWGHSRSWGYGPSGGLGLVVLILVVLLLMGKL